MEYLTVAEARQRSGLRLALSVGGPFAYGQAVKSILEIKGIPYLAVAQRPGQNNDALFAWTGFRNAPVAKAAPASSAWSPVKKAASFEDVRRRPAAPRPRVCTGRRRAHAH